MSGGIPNSTDACDDEEEENDPPGMVPRIPNLPEPEVPLRFPSPNLGFETLDLFGTSLGGLGPSEELKLHPRVRLGSPQYVPDGGITNGPGVIKSIYPEVVPSSESDSNSDSGVDESFMLPTLASSGSDFTFIGTVGSKSEDINVFTFPPDQGDSFYWEQPVGDLGYYNTPDGVVSVYVTGEPGNYTVHTASAGYFDPSNAKSNDDLIDIINIYAEANDGYPYRDEDGNGIPDHWAENDPDFGEAYEADTSDIDLDDMSLYSSGDDSDDSDDYDYSDDFDFDTWDDFWSE